MKLFMENSSYLYSNQYLKGLEYCHYLPLEINKWLAYPLLSIDFKLALCNILYNHSTQVLLHRQVLRPP
jgi:hypothetical protein